MMDTDPNVSYTSTEQDGDVELRRRRSNIHELHQYALCSQPQSHEQRIPGDEICAKSAIESIPNFSYVLLNSKTSDANLKGCICQICQHFGIFLGNAFYQESVVRALRYVGLALTQHTYNTAKKLSAIFSNQRRLYAPDTMAEISSSSLIHIGLAFKSHCPL